MPFELLILLVKPGMVAARKPWVLAASFKMPFELLILIQVIFGGRYPTRGTVADYAPQVPVLSCSS